MDAATRNGAQATLAAFERAVLSTPIGDWRAAADEAATVDWFVLAELVKVAKVWEREGNKGKGAAVGRSIASIRKNQPPNLPPPLTFSSAHLPLCLLHARAVLRRPVHPVWAHLGDDAGFW